MTNYLLSDPNLPIKTEQVNSYKDFFLKKLKTSCDVICLYAVPFFSYFAAEKKFLQAETRIFVHRFCHNKNFTFLQNFSFKMGEVWRRFCSRVPFFSKQLLNSEELEAFQQSQMAEDILSSPEELLELSKLKKEASLIDPEAFSFFLGASSQENSAAFYNSFSYIHQFFSKKDLPSPSLAPVQKALQEEEAVSELIKKHKKSSEKERRKALLDKAQDLQQKANALKAGESSLFFGKIPSSNSSLLSSLSKYLPREFSQWFSSRENPEMLESLKTQLLKAFKGNECTFDRSFGDIDKVYKAIRQTLGQKLEGLVVLSPQLKEQILTSLEEDFKEIVSESIPQESLQKFINAWTEGQGEQVLDDLISKWLRQCKELIQKPVQEISDHLGNSLPFEAVEAACYFGVNCKLQPRFWLELHREEEGRGYTVRLFSNDLEIHPSIQSSEGEGKHIPLVFYHLSLDQLNEDFFYKLLSYQVPIEWNGVEYSLSDVSGWLEGALELKKDSPYHATVYSSPTPLNENKHSWLRLYWHHHLHLDTTSFSKAFDYDLPLQMLIDVWPHIHQNPERLKNKPALLKGLREMVFSLRKRGIKLYEEKMISLDELKALYATLWEAEEALKKVSVSSSLADAQKVNSPLFPPEVQYHVSRFLAEAGLSTSNKEMLSEFLTTVLGESFQDIFEDFFEELHYPITLESQAPSSEVSRKEFLQLTFWQNQFSGLIPKRLSLLHLFKFYVSASRALSVAIRFGGCVKILKTLFTRYLPMSGLAPLPLAIIVAVFGPWIVQKILPKSVLEPLEAIFGLARDVVNHIIGRVHLKILQALLPHFIQPEELARLRESAEKMKATWLRKGELSFQAELPRALEKKPKVQIDLPKEDSISKPEPLSEIDLLPRPSIRTLALENLLEELTLWGEHVREENFPSHNREKKLQKHFYLNRQIRNLPIPGNDGGEIWSHHPEPLELLESLHVLLYELYNVNITEKSLDQSLESMISFYSLYAIIDTLSRRIKWAHIPENTKANGQGLVYWLQFIGYTFSDPRTYERLQQVAQYFEIDLLKKYSGNDLYHYEEGRLFQHSFSQKNSKKVFLWQKFFEEEDSVYYQSLLEDQTIKQRLALHGMNEETPLLEKVMLLFRDPSLKETLGRLQQTELRTAYLTALQNEDVQLRLKLHKMQPQTAWLASYLTALEDPQIKKRLVSYGMPENTPLRLRIKLFSDIFHDYSTLKNLKEKKLEDEEYQLLIDKMMPRKDIDLLYDDFIKEQLDWHGIDIIGFSLSGTKNALSDPIVQQAIEQVGSEDFLAQPLFSVKQELPLLSESRRDQRHGLLPRPFYFLRLAHLMAQREASASFRLYGPNPLFNPDSIGLQIYEKIEGSSSSFWERALQQSKEIFHRMTLNSLRMNELYANIRLRALKDLPSNDQPRNGAVNGRWRRSREVHQNGAFQANLSWIGSLNFIPQPADSRRIFQMNDYENELKFQMLKPSRQLLSQSALTVEARLLIEKHSSKDAPAPKREIQLEEQRILAMIAAEPSDQIVRALSFFVQSKDHLSEPIFSFLLKMFIYQIPLVHAQLKERPSLVKDIGQFFVQTIEYFNHRREWEVSLKLAKFSQELLILCEPFDPNAASYFPSMAHLVAETIAPTCREENSKLRFKQNDLLLAYFYLVASYLHLDPEKVQEIEKRKIMHWVALLFYTKMHNINIKASHDIALKSSSVFYLWKPHIERAIQKDKTFRDELLDRLMLDFFTPLTGGKACLDMNPGSWEGEFPNYRKGEWSFSLLEMSLSVIEKLENTSREISTETVEKNVAKSKFLQVQEQAPKCFLLSQIDHHGLSLLQWFQPSHDIQITFAPDGGGQIEQIFFPELNLTYQVKKNRAVDISGHTPGYFISPVQRHPQLISYGQYLLLENEGGEKKIHLIAYPISTLLSLYFLKNLAKLPNSAWLETALNRWIKKKEWRFFTYSLTQQGELESHDDKALAYLALFLLIRGDMEKSYVYFEKLQDWGRLHPFSQETWETFSCFSLPLLLSQSLEAEKYLLQLAALQEYNCLLHQKEIHPRNEYLECLEYVAIQSKYNEYLKRIEKGGHPYLSSRGEFYDELFLLRSLASKNMRFISSQIPKKEERAQLFSWMDSLGLDLVASRLLMIPKLAKRYQFLKAVYEKDNSWSALSERLFLNQLFPENEEPSSPPSQRSEISIDYAPKISIFTRLLSLYRSTNDQPLAQHEIPSDFDPCEFFAKPNIEEVSIELSALTPTYLSRQFLSFYYLALGVPPNAWQSDEEKMAAFHAKAKLFQERIPFLQGKITFPIEAIFCGILFTAPTFLKNISSFQYPKPAELETFYQEKVQSKLFSELQILHTQSKMIATSRSTFHCVKDVAIEQTQKLFVNYLQAYCQRPTLKDLGLEVLSELLGSRHLAKLYPLAHLTFNVFNAIRHERNEKSAIQYQREKQVEGGPSLPLSHPPLQPKLLQAMQEEESKITHVMKSLLHLYFELTPLKVPRKEKRTIFPAGKVPRETRGVQEEFLQIEKSLQDFYARSEPQDWQYLLREGVKEGHLRQDLFDLEKEITQELALEKKGIEEYANQKIPKALSEEEKVIALMKKEQLKERKLSFSEINHALLQENDEFFDAFTDLTPERKLELKKQVYLYHIKASRWNFFFEQMRSIKGLESIAFELDRERVYSFEKMPEKITRGKLFFESRTGKLLWIKQSVQFDRLLMSSEKHLVLELIMGSGKSIYGIPESDYVQADQNTLVINVWPEPLLRANIKSAAKQGKTVFGQTANALEITRSTRWPLGMQLIFEKIRTERGQINASKENLQALELTFLERMFKEDRGSWEEKSSLDEQRHVLRSVRSNGVCHVDEAHIAYRSDKELNFPLGAPGHISLPYAKIVEEVLFLLISSEEFKHLLTIQADAPSPLSQEVFQEQIAPLLAEKISAFPLLGIPEESRSECILYMIGKAEKIPNAVWYGHKEEIALVKGLLTVLLPSALAQIIHEDFNPSKNGKEEQARPSEGNMNPSENSTIRNPFETLVKTGLLLLRDRLTTSQCDTWIKYLRKKAQMRVFHGRPDRAGIFYGEFSIEEKRALQSTIEAEWFAKTCPGLRLFTYTREDLPQIYEAIKTDDRMVLRYLTYLISREIRYFPENLSSNSANFASMFARTLGDTGSPYNAGGYLEGTEILWDLGTNGESVDLLLTPGKVSMQCLEHEAPEKVLEEIIDTCFRKHPKDRALIERGALLNGMESKAVASELVHYISKRDDLDAVAFYLEQDLMIWEKGAASPIPIGRSKVSIERRLTYFPQPQTYGADCPQIESAVGIVTIGENLCFHELAQAIWRMRGLKDKQTLKFVFTKKVRDKIMAYKKSLTDEAMKSHLESMPAQFRALAKGFLKSSPNTRSTLPTALDVILFSLRNQGAKLPLAQYESAKQKLYNVVRRAVLDKVLFAPDLDTAIHYLKPYKNLFISTVSADPFFLFGLIDQFVEPAEIFKQIRENLYLQIEHSSLFTEEEKARIRHELKMIGQGVYPEKVHSYQSGGKLDDSRLDINKQAQIEQSSELNSEADQEAERQMQLEIETEIYAQVNVQKNKPKLIPQEFSEWESSLDPLNLDWLEISEAPFYQEGSYYKGKEKNDIPLIFSLQDTLYKSKHQDLEKIAPKISSMVLTSNNVTYLAASNGCPIQPFGPGQIPLFEALLIKKGSDATYILLIDQKEAYYWRNKLKEAKERAHSGESVNVNIALFDLSLQRIVAEGPHPFPLEELSKPLFKRALAQVLFLRGDVSFIPELYEIVKRWGASQIDAFTAYAKYIATEHGTAPLEGSQLENLLMEFEMQQANSEKKKPSIRV